MTPRLCQEGICHLGHTVICFGCIRQNAFVWTLQPLALQRSSVFCEVLDGKQRSSSGELQLMHSVEFAIPLRAKSDAQGVSIRTLKLLIAICGTLVVSLRTGKFMPKPKFGQRFKETFSAGIVDSMDKSKFRLPRFAQGRVPKPLENKKKAGAGVYNLHHAWAFDQHLLGRCRTKQWIGLVLGGSLTQPRPDLQEIPASQCTLAKPSQDLYGQHTKGTSTWA